MPPQQQQPRLRGRGQVNRAGGSDSVTRPEDGVKMDRGGDEERMEC